MTKKRICYQCGDDDIEAIQAKRNEEIRAYGRKVLADADAALNLERPEAPNLILDWDIIDEPNAERAVSLAVDPGTEVSMDATAATEPQETDDIKAKVEASPKPETQADKPVEEAEKPAKASAKSKAAPSKE